MWFPPLFLLAAPAQVPPRPKPVEAVIVLEARSISLPLLPKDGEDGRGRYSKIHQEIRTAQKDLVAALEGLDPTLVQAEIPPQGLAVPKSRAAQAEALVAILKDTTHRRLEQDFLEAWKGWQAALVEGGLAKSAVKPVPASPSGAAHFEKVHSVAREALKGIPRRRLGRDRSSAEYNEENADLFPDIQYGLSEEQHEVFSRTERGQELARHRLTVANRVIPNLGEFWSPLVTHLNTLAEQLSELDQTPLDREHANLRLLRVKAKQAYLERFRRCLWYCDLVWSQTVLAEPPAPPVPVQGNKTR